MGTWYTFATALTKAGSLEDNELQKRFNEEKELNPGYFAYTRHILGKRVYYTGYSKNLGGGFYDYPGMLVDVNTAWVDDEGGHGFHGFIHD